MYNNSTMTITEYNYEQHLTELFDCCQTFPLRKFVAGEIGFYVDNTTSWSRLGLYLKEKELLCDHEYQTLHSLSTPFEKYRFLYEALNKKVKTKQQYVGLFRALFKSGNEHIAEILFEKLTAGIRQPCQIDRDPESADPNSSNAPLVGVGRNTTRIIQVNQRTFKLLIVFVAGVVCICSGLSGVLVYIHYSQSGVEDSGLLNTALTSSLNQTTTHRQLHPSDLQPEELEEELHNSKSYTNLGLTTDVRVQPVLATENQDSVKSILANASSESLQPITAIPNTNNVSLTIGSPKDFPHSAGANLIVLTLNNSVGSSWEDWYPDIAIASKVVSLKLNGIFTPREIRHFLSIMDNLTTLSVGNLTGKLFGKHFNFVTNPLVHKSLKVLRITHLEDQQCKNLYQFLTVSFNFPSLTRVEIVNLPIMLENEENIVNFFQKYQTQLTQCDFQNVIVHLGSQAFSNLKFGSLVSLHSEFREPYSEGAKSVFSYLNRATPNLVDISTNIVCSEKEKVGYDKNWPKINGKKRMVCDLREKAQTV